MLRNAIEIREVRSQEGASRSFEVYDSDTGTSLGNYDSLERAEAERRNMASSDAAAKKGEANIDPGSE